MGKERRGVKALKVVTVFLGSLGVVIPAPRKRGHTLRVDPHLSASRARRGGFMQHAPCREGRSAPAGAGAGG